MGYFSKSNGLTNFVSLQSDLQITTFVVRIRKSTLLNHQEAGALFHTLTCGPGVFSDNVNHSKLVRNQSTVMQMIKNVKKTR